jgi:hypothetical protein
VNLEGSVSTTAGDGIPEIHSNPQFIRADSRGRSKQEEDREAT